MIASSRPVMLLAEVVPVARKPEVFVRVVTPEEGRRLQKITKTSRQPIRVRRAIVVMASAQRQPVPAIARLMQVSEAYVRQVIHEFNERGFEALDPKWTPLANSGVLSDCWPEGGEV
ncbi:helix-turn-helix domain-containing protein [Nocardia sp. CA-128927]|uniref:helix-turn-helix domain-containing protein n=1 Tax=Nocardia sp. CA-128927 TaxID=3239975 RepID=UPI003D974089